MHQQISLSFYQDIHIFSGNIGGSSWGISSIFGGGDRSVKENVASKQHAEPFHSVEQSFSMIHLTEVCIYVAHLSFSLSLCSIGVSFHICFVL